MKHLDDKPEAKLQAKPQSATNHTSESADPHDGRLAVALHKIGPELAGQRLDHYLVRICKGVPKSHLYRILRSGEVRVSGKRSSGDYRLVEGDVIRVPPIRITVASSEQAPLARVKPQDFEVLFEDDYLLVINKPAGIAVHGGSGVSSGVIEQLRASRPECKYLELVHRIDKETSGILILAKRRSSLAHLQEQFRSRSIAKHYRAVVLASVPKRTKTFDGNLLIRVQSDGQKLVSVRPDGVSAITRITGLEQTKLTLGGIEKTLSLVDAKIETGRTHQIRVHLAHHGWPIVGDQKYGDFEVNKLLSKASIKRMFLHAFSVSFYHPNPTKSEGSAASSAPRKQYLEAPLPGTFRQLFPAEHTKFST